MTIYENLSISMPLQITPTLVVDSMYGSGRGVIKGILQGTGCEVQEIRAEMNPGFGGVHPNPSCRNLGALAGAISTHMGDFGLATDGDADRIGAMDERVIC
jgi:phosphomannomutase